MVEKRRGSLIQLLTRFIENRRYSASCVLKNLDYIYKEVVINGVRFATGEKARK